MGNSIRKQVADLFQFALILCTAVVILVPIYWIASGAFKQQVDVFQLKLLFTPTLANFDEIFRSPYNLHEKLFNSTLVAGTTVIVAIPMATMFLGSGMIDKVKQSLVENLAKAIPELGEMFVTHLEKNMDVETLFGSPFGR